MTESLLVAVSTARELSDDVVLCSDLLQWPLDSPESYDLLRLHVSWKELMLPTIVSKNHNRSNHAHAFTDTPSFASSLTKCHTHTNITSHQIIESIFYPLLDCCNTFDTDHNLFQKKKTAYLTPFRNLPSQRRDSCPFPLSRSALCSLSSCASISRFNKCGLSLNLTTLNAPSNTHKKNNNCAQEEGDSKSEVSDDENDIGVTNPIDQFDMDILQAMIEGVHRGDDFGDYDDYGEK